MDDHPVSITITDDAIWKQRIDRLKALISVNEPHHLRESKWRVNLLLRAAAKEGDIDKFIEALENHSANERVSLSDIFDIEGPSGNSLLHVAADIEKADILKALLEVIPDERLPTMVNNQLDTPLHIAARADNICMATLLVRYSSIVDMANDAGNTALHEAVKNRNHELTDLLLKNGSTSVNKENKESKCPLYLAVETGDLKILERLMKEVGGNEVLTPRMQGMSPVHGAVMHRRRDMLEKMSEHKKELFDLTDAGDGTPLHLAAYDNYVDGVNFLVNEFPWSAILKDKEGYFPIHWPDPKELLTFKERQNMLHVAAKYGRASVVKYILGDTKLVKLINAKDKKEIRLYMWPHCSGSPRFCSLSPGTEELVWSL